MRKISYISLLLFFCSVSFLFSQTPIPLDKLEWHTSMQEAHELSKATNKPIFAFFTGSDWCGWCKKLQNEVFSKPEFIEWAKKNVILLELDFPRRTQLPPELAKQNNSLQQALKVNSYPTVWILFTSKNETTNNFNITPLGSLGYPDNPEIGKEQIKFLENANRILSLVKVN